MADKRLPKAVVFDLEYAFISGDLYYYTAHTLHLHSYTLWDLWIDTHITGVYPTRSLPQSL